MHVIKKLITRDVTIIIELYIVHTYNYNTLWNILYVSITIVALPCMSDLSDRVLTCVSGLFQVAEYRSAVVRVVSILQCVVESSGVQMHSVVQVSCFNSYLKEVFRYTFAYKNVLRCT